MRSLFRKTVLVLFLTGILFWYFSGDIFLFGNGKSEKTHKVMNMPVRKTRTTLEPPYKCFQLFNNSTEFSSFIDSKNKSCGLISQYNWIGRAGNQMFEVAAVIGIAQQLDMIPVFNLKNSLMSKYFDIPNTVNTDIHKFAKCEEKGYGIYSDCKDIYQKRSTTSQNIMVVGYRQSWKYFYDATKHVRNVFQFKPYYITEARHFVTNQTILHHGNVCIHVRRGDFLGSNGLANGRVVADTDFLSKAMAYYENKFKRVRFIVLSDDITWCKGNIKGKVAFSPYKDPGVDLAIMSLCDHLIVTSGTFGWWGAWLSKGTVVYFDGSLRNGSILSTRLNNSDYYPPTWIKL